MHWARVLMVMGGAAMATLGVAGGWVAPVRGAGVAKTAVGAASPNAEVACAGCHAEITARYAKTPMARASGVAMDGVLTGNFKHAASGVEYKVFERAGKLRMSYERVRGRGGSEGDPELKGERELAYFVGSGHDGRTYLYEEAGLWFEAPINYYGMRRVWDMAPNFSGARAMPDALPVDANCLHCHATNLNKPQPTARNRYVDGPFERGGIGCGSCHGDGAAHVASGGKAAIVNPEKLTALRRDSVCLQCHLEGDAAVPHAENSLASFRVGDDLSDHVTYFVKASAQGGGGRAASQYEALLRSACKRASGDKLTCTTCHDPHDSPSAAERVGYFRGKCLSCHTGQAIATHHAEQQDCAVCHMPSRKTTDISHEQSADHDIERRPGAQRARFTRLEATDELVPVGPEKVGDRETGLAYAQLAQHGDQRAGERALRLLQQAERSGADDAELHTQLGFLRQVSGDVAGARQEYVAALTKDANNATALGNLAVMEASIGKVDEAVALLERVARNDPSQMAAGMNLAFLECSVGKKSKALEVLGELRRFNPDDAALHAFLTTGAHGGLHCDLHGSKGGR